MATELQAEHLSFQCWEENQPDTESCLGRESGKSKLLIDQMTVALLAAHPAHDLPIIQKMAT
jgi:hypothetical protein